MTWISHAAERRRTDGRPILRALPTANDVCQAPIHVHAADPGLERFAASRPSSHDEMPRPVLRVASRDGAVMPASGGRFTFDDFFEQESETLFRRMWLVTRDRTEAEEVMQDAFIAILERWDRVSGMDDPVGYLYRTAFNVWNKRSRKAARAVRGLLAPSPPDDFAAAEARTMIDAALAGLAPRQRAALVLTDLLGYTSQEAGAILGIRAVTARVHASQARAAIRRDLGDADG